MDTLAELPLAAIAPHALLRDRTALDPAALATLQASIALDGVRMPIEVWRLSTPRDPHHYGLISGLRRLTAAGHAGLTTIPAFIRTPADVPAAMAAMVTENEIRSPVSPWEKGALIMAVVDDGLCDTPDAAIETLYPALPRQARTRLRTFAMVVEVLQNRFTTPERLTIRQIERLATLLRGGMEEIILETLRAHHRRSLDTQWSAIMPLLEEARRTESRPTPEPHPPRRLLHLRQGLTIRREISRDGWLLRFSGPEARKGGLIEDVFDMVERWFQKG
jgi:ParB family transcriptional regulator, chromosome partitioning protein